MPHLSLPSLAGLVHGSPVVFVVAMHVGAGIFFVLLVGFFFLFCTPFDPKWPNESVFLERGLLKEFS